MEEIHQSQRADAFRQTLQILSVRQEQIIGQKDIYEVDAEYQSTFRSLHQKKQSLLSQINELLREVRYYLPEPTAGHSAE
jgi:hypothetical protein